MLFEHFPYSNFHNLNLDWLIREMKKLIGITEQATETANEAKNLVEGAATSAAEAKTAADNAKTAADAAKAAADAAVDVATTSADEAKEVADRALTTANGASTVANAARTSADTAIGTANTANNTASTAMQTAARAETVADGIDGKATKAMEDAAAALDDITNVSRNAYAPRGIQDLASGAKPFNTVDAGGAVVAYKPSAPLGTDNMDNIYNQIPWGPFIDCSFAYQKAEGEEEGGAFHMFAPNDSLNWGDASGLPVTVSHLTPSGQATFTPVAYLPICDSQFTASFVNNSYKSSLQYNGNKYSADLNSMTEGGRYFYITTDSQVLNKPSFSSGVCAVDYKTMYDNGYAYQFCYVLGGGVNNTRIGFRKRYSNDFGDWKEIATMDRLESLNTQISNLVNAINAPLTRKTSRVMGVPVTDADIAKRLTIPYPEGCTVNNLISYSTPFIEGETGEVMKFWLLGDSPSAEGVDVFIGGDVDVRSYWISADFAYHETVTLLPSINTLDLPPEEWDSANLEFSDETMQGVLDQTTPPQTEQS